MTRLMMRFVLALAVVCGSALGGWMQTLRAQSPAAGVEKLTVPPGFAVDVYAANVPFARQLAVAPSGTVFVGSMKLGAKAPYAVHALVDRDKDHKADDVIVVATGLDSPNGVAFHKGALYVAEFTRILNTSEMKDMLAKQGTEVRAGPPEALGTFIASERTRWAKVVKENGIKAD